MKRQKRDDEDEKGDERRASNRRRDLQSRQRSSMLFEDLQKKVKDAFDISVQLRNTNTELRAQLEAALHENTLLKQHNPGLGPSQDVTPQSVTVLHAPAPSTSCLLHCPENISCSSSGRSNELSTTTLVSDAEGLPNAMMVQSKTLPQLESQRSSEKANRQEHSSQTLVTIPNLSILQNPEMNWILTNNSGTIHHQNTNQMQQSLAIDQTILLNCTDTMGHSAADSKSQAQCSDTEILSNPHSNQIDQQP